MNFLSNMHTHTGFSDGKNSIEEMVESAYQKGFVSIGLSDHSYISSFSESMKPEAMEAYLQEIAKVRNQYQDKIEVYAGIEWDFYSDPALLSTHSFDYIIGSVHDIRIWDQFYCVDDQPEMVAAGIQACDGDEKQFCKIYYKTILQLLHDGPVDIVGHLDLIKKLNQDNRFFDENASWYQLLILEVMDFIAEKNLVLEVNTGGMARGYRTDPYPSDTVLEYAIEQKIPLTLSSDSHDKATIDYAFNEVSDRLRSLGCKSLVQMKNAKWEEVSL